jgi:complement component 1 Q subcomponent-binding protein, mitochondrial
MPSIGASLGSVRSFADEKKPSAGVALAEILTSELLHENANNNEVDEDYEDIKSTIAKYFKITDKKDFGVITLTRVYKGEKITVRFDCQDEVENYEDDEGYDRLQEKMKLQEESELTQDDLTSENQGVPGVNFEVVIGKVGGGELAFNCVATGNQQINIENVKFSPEDADDVDSRYGGPRYVDLDENVRDAFQAYLAERKIDEDFAYYVVSEARYKEEREYRNWLENLSNFVV